MAVSSESLAAQLRLSSSAGLENRLYGVVDGAQDLELAFEAKCIYGQEIRSLFEGDVAPALADVAPYVVPIDPDSGYLENWSRRWGTNSGILLTTSADLDALHTHLRSIFIAEDEEGQQYFFRFYDPRVLRVYLPTCTPDECAQFFGPVSSYLAEDGNTSSLLRHSAGSGGLEVTAHKLSIYESINVPS